jgi:hypothetical protein
LQTSHLIPLLAVRTRTLEFCVCRLAAVDALSAPGIECWHLSAYAILSGLSAKTRRTWAIYPMIAERPRFAMIPSTSRKLLGGCMAWGFAIEAPMLAWFISVQDRFHVSVIPGMLFVFHLASYFLMRLFLWPIENHVSTSAFERLAYLVMGCLQAIIIGSALFAVRLQRRQKTSE